MSACGDWLIGTGRCGRGGPGLRVLIQGRTYGLDLYGLAILCPLNQHPTWVNWTVLLDCWEKSCSL